MCATNITMTLFKVLYYIWHMSTPIIKFKTTNFACGLLCTGHTRLVICLIFKGTVLGHLLPTEMEKIPA